MKTDLNTASDLIKFGFAHEVTVIATKGAERIEVDEMYLEILTDDQIMIGGYLKEGDTGDLLTDARRNWCLAECTKLTLTLT